MVSGSVSLKEGSGRLLGHYSMTLSPFALWSLRHMVYTFNFSAGGGSEIGRSLSRIHLATYPTGYKTKNKTQQAKERYQGCPCTRYTSIREHTENVRFSIYYPGPVDQLKTEITLIK